jgi:hypothetical protein
VTARRIRRSRAVIATVFALLLLSLAAVSSCGFISTGHIPAYNSTNPNGDEICGDFSQKMQGTSSKWAALAWTAGIIGTMGSLLGGILGAGKDTDKLYRRSSGVILASLGSLLAATAAYSISRSSAASDAAAAATRARAEPDDHARFVKCLNARAQWLESRAASLDKTPPPGPKKD